MRETLVEKDMHETYVTYVTISECMHKYINAKNLSKKMHAKTYVTYRLW